MTSITLGPARIGDAPRIAAMSRELIESGLPWNWTPRRIASHMRGRENLLVAAKAERELVGFIMAQFGTEAVHLTLLGVAETHRRMGVGRQLVRWVEESAVIAGLFLVKLEVRAGNLSARRFYKALRYEESGLVPGYYSGIEDAITLSCDLRSTDRAERKLSGSE